MMLADEDQELPAGALHCTDPLGGVEGGWIESGGVLPAVAPLHPAKLLPPVAAAVSVTCVP
jgi:hypothetical protein